jgi:two-component system CheB/CheR fusion protein
MSQALKVLFKPLEDLELTIGECLEFITREHEARIEAETANRQKDIFLAMVSHELRNPLHSMIGWIKLLRYGKLEESIAKQAMEAIERSIRAQTRLVNDLVDFSRISNGKLQLELREVEVAPIIENSLNDIQLSAEAKQIQLIRQINPNLGRIKADQQRLEQVMLNLLLNAVKFTPCGGEVKVKAERTVSEVEVKVTDSGRGIDSSFLPFVFDPFSQDNRLDHEKQIGLGLGLSIARQIIEQHGGAMVAESPGLGQGATFCVKFPAIFTR